MEKVKVCGHRQVHTIMPRQPHFSTLAPSIMPTTNPLSDALSIYQCPWSVRVSWIADWLLFHAVASHPLILDPLKKLYSSSLYLLLCFLLWTLLTLRARTKLMRKKNEIMRCNSNTWWTPRPLLRILIENRPTATKTLYAFNNNKLTKNTKPHRLCFLLYSN